jgi:hypothetical protein
MGTPFSSALFEMLKVAKIDAAVIQMVRWAISFPWKDFELRVNEHVRRSAHRAVSPSETKGRVRIHGGVQCTIFQPSFGNELIRIGAICRLVV